MINFVYLSEAGEYQQELREKNGYEIGSEVESIQKMRQLSLGPIDLAFLQRAFPEH